MTEGLGVLGVAYIAGKYRAEEEVDKAVNIMNASKVMEKFLKKGYAVICPHKNTSFLDGVIPEENFLTSYLAILSRLDAERGDIIIMVDGWEDSQGACAELALARELCIPAVSEHGTPIW